MIDFGLLQKAIPYLLKGAVITVQITVIAYILGCISGIILGYLHTVRNLIIRYLISIYVTIIRGTPMLIQISFCYYVLPFMGLELPPFWAATMAIAINSSAYMSQIIKSGILGVGSEQIEAARVLGFSSWQTAQYIVIPQAIRIVFPALVSEYVTLLKDSSLASVIGVSELYKEARSIMNETYDVITIFFLVTAFYLILTSFFEFLLMCVERKMGWYVKN